MSQSQSHYHELMAGEASIQGKNGSDDTSKVVKVGGINCHFSLLNMTQRIVSLDTRSNMSD